MDRSIAYRRCNVRRRATATVVAAVLAPLKLFGGMFIPGWLIQPDQIRRVRNFTGAG